MLEGRSVTAGKAAGEQELVVSKPLEPERLDPIAGAPPIALGGLGGGGGGDLFKKQTNANQRQCTPQSGISASLFSTPNLVKPQDTHTVSETENRTSCLTTLVKQSQSVAVSQTSAISVG